MPDTGLRVNTYGKGKTGKTRFATTFPKPLLIMGTEDGTKSIKTTPGVDFLRLERSEDVSDLVELISKQTGSKWKLKGDKLVEVPMGNGDPYVSACLDHGSGYQGIILREVLNLEALPMQMTWGQAEMGDWLATAAQFKEHVAKLLKLSESHGTHVVVIAHEKNFTEDRPDANMLVPTIASDLSPTIARWLNGMVDYVVQCFIKEEEKVKKVMQGIGKKAKPVEKRYKTGKKSYCLRIGPHENYMTGFRHVDGIELPPYIVNATFDKIQSLIKGEPIEADSI